MFGITSGKQLLLITGHTGSVNQVKFSNSGNEIISCSDDSTVIIWSFPEAEKKKSYFLGNIVTDFAFNTISGKLLCASKDIFEIDLEKETVLPFNQVSKYIYNCIAYNQSTNSIAVGDEKARRVFIYDVGTQTKLKTLKSKSISLSYNEDFSKLFSAASNGILVKWEIPKSNIFTRYKIAEGTRRQSVTDIAVNNELFAFCSKDNFIYVHEIKSGNRKYILSAHNDWPKSIVISPDGKILASTGKDKTINLWDLESGKLVKSISGTANRINCLRFSKDWNHIIIGYDNGMIKDWDFRNNHSIITGILDPGEFKKKHNWHYSINSIDSVSDHLVSLRTVLIKNFSSDENRIKKITDYTALWNLEKNEFALNEHKTKKHKFKSNTRLESLETIILNPKNSGINKLQIISNNEIGFVNKSGENIIIPTGHTDKITSIVYNSKYNFILSASWDGLLKLWDANSGRLILSAGALGQNDFFMIDQDRHYYASKGALKSIGFRINDKIYSFDQFDLEFNRPDLVLGALPYTSEEVKITYERAYKKRILKMGSVNNLEQETPLLSVKLNNVTNSLDNAKLIVEAKAMNVQLSSLHVLVNGVPEFGIEGKSVTGKFIFDTLQVDLCEGMNEIQVYIKNINEVCSLKENFQINNPKTQEKPNLYLVCIGASDYYKKEFNLNYAAKDAEDISKILKHAKFYNKKFIKVFKNTSVNKSIVDSIKLHFGKASINDVVMLYIAGHGVLDENLDYYLATFNIDFSNPAKEGISYESLYAVFDKIKSRKKLLLIDACHSGEIDKDEVEVADNSINSKDGEIKFRNVGTNIKNKDGLSLTNSFELAKILFADMRESNGTTVISASGGAEYALEGKGWKNGIFTYSFIKALIDRKCDRDSDGRIYISELQQYLIEEVSKLTNGLQTSTSRSENLVNDFRIW